jgi:hypothetical protein
MKGDKMNGNDFLKILIAAKVFVLVLSVVIVLVLIYM